MSTKVDVDLLTEDTPIPGQEFGVYSFLSPEGIKGCTVRAFKNRGSFATYEEASKYAEKIRNLEPTFHVFVGENFKWTAFDPDPNLVKDNSNYYEPKLQELMKGTIENQEKAKEYEAQRKRQMIEDSIKEEIKKKKEHGGDSTRERLKKKLEKKKADTDKNEDDKITKDLDTHKITDKEYNEKKQEVAQLKEETNTIDENLEKMKKLYADLMKKKQANNSV
jgi:hypothetical protein